MSLALDARTDDRMPTVWTREQKAEDVVDAGLSQPKLYHTRHVAHISQSVSD